MPPGIPIHPRSTAVDSISAFDPKRNWLLWGPEGTNVEDFRDVVRLHVPYILAQSEIRNYVWMGISQNSASRWRRYERGVHIRGIDSTPRGIIQACASQSWCFEESRTGAHATVPAVTYAYHCRGYEPVVCSPSYARSDAEACQHSETEGKEPKGKKYNADDPDQL